MLEVYSDASEYRSPPFTHFYPNATTVYAWLVVFEFFFIDVNASRRWCTRALHIHRRAAGATVTSCTFCKASGPFRARYIVCLSWPNFYTYYLSHSITHLRHPLHKHGLAWSGQPLQAIYFKGQQFTRVCYFPMLIL